MTVRMYDNRRMATVRLGGSLFHLWSSHKALFLVHRSVFGGTLL